MLCSFLITVRRVIQTVCIFVLHFPARPFLGLVGEADFPPVLLPDLSIMFGICLLVLI